MRHFPIIIGYDNPGINEDKKKTRASYLTEEATMTLKVERVRTTFLKPKASPESME